MQYRYQPYVVLSLNSLHGHTVSRHHPCHCCNRAVPNPVPHLDSNCVRIYVGHCVAGGGGRTMRPLP